MHSTIIPNIILIGLRGSGKTTLARELAVLVGRDAQVIDLDPLVLAGCHPCTSIAAVFEQCGESTWRDAEVRVYREQLGTVASETAHPHIIAFGGGAAMTTEIRSLLQELQSQNAPDQTKQVQWRVVYLRGAPDLLSARLEAADHHDHPT